MNVIAAAKALNQKAAREKWFHFCDPSLAFSDPSYEPLLNLWRSKTGDRQMPKRSDISPRDLKDVLRHLLVLERVERAPSRYRVRLIGTGLTGLAGDRTGKMIDEIVPPEHLPRWIECCDLILDGGKPMRFLGRVHLEGREYLDAENLYVPLANDNDVPTYAMALCRYTPRRVHDEETWENQIASIPGGLF
jgi:hypothetical protein